ncbi:unnamed protein product [Jaminaea pallidilutea]
MLSRAYNSVSARGSKGKEAAREDQFAADAGGDNASQTTAVHGSGRSEQVKGFDGIFDAPAEGCRPKPPAKLTDQQETALAEMLKYFRAKEKLPTSLNEQSTEQAPTDWEKLRMLSRESMLRYLRATKWDIAQAKKRLTDTIAWRREFGVDNLNPDELEPEARSGKETVLGFDNAARPLHYMHPHRNDTKETPRQMQFAVWILERCIDMMPPGVEQLALLINFDSKSRNPTSITNAKLMLYILQNHYVERLGVALCINVPWIFKAFWSGIQPFIDPVTKSKCKFDEGIKSEVPLSQLSKDFGGDLDPKYQHEKYWHQLVKACDKRREMMLKRFKEQCNSEIGASEWVIRGGNDPASSPPLAKKDIDAIAEEAPDRNALGRTNSNKPAEAPTTQVSDPKRELDGTKAREQAKEASHRRSDRLHEAEGPGTTPSGAEAGAAKSPAADTTQKAPILPNGHSDDAAPDTFPSNDTDTNDRSETYKTPSDNVNSNPLDRPFSSMDAAAVSAGGAFGLGAAGVEASKSAPVKEGDKEASRGFLATMSKMVHHENHHQQHASSNGTSASGAAASKQEVTVLLFAAARDAAGTSSVSLRLPSSPYPLRDLATLLSLQELRDMPRLQNILARSQWSVDQTMVDDDELEQRVLKGGEEVAVIPPVSGG